MGCIHSRDGKIHKLATKPARTLVRPDGTSRSQWRHQQAVLQANSGFGFGGTHPSTRVAKVPKLSPAARTEPPRQRRWSPSVDAGELFANDVPEPASNATWVPKNKVSFLAAKHSSFF